MAYTGEIFALAAAIFWAFAVILLRRAGETVSPFALNLYRVAVSSVLLVLVLLASGVPLLASRPLQDHLILVASGVIGIALSDTLFHRCLNLVGAGINAIIDCLYSPFVAIFALVLLSEKLGPWQLAGMALVISGVLATTRAIPPAGTTRQELLAGIAWGVLAMVTLAIGIVIAKPVLTRAPLLWVVTYRQLASLAVMIPLAALSPHRSQIWSVFRPTRTWRFTLPATILGSFLALTCWIAGMKYTETGTAAILNQTSTIFILVFASLFLHEPFTLRRVIAAALAVAGILMVTLG
jgi:drug/metabolite transporter (DMT)-like permease